MRDFITITHLDDSLTWMNANHIYTIRHKKDEYTVIYADLHDGELKPHTTTAEKTKNPLTYANITEFLRSREFNRGKHGVERIQKEEAA